MNQQLAKYGAYIGGAITLFSFSMYSIAVNSEAIVQNITYIIIIFGLFMSLKHYRDTELNGFMDYGKAVGIGMIITLLFSIIVSIYSYLLFKLDPEAISRLMEQSYQQLYEAGKSEEEIEQLMKLTDEFMTPGLLGFSSFFSHAIMGGLFTLLIGIFVKRKNPNPFEGVEG